ncbi:hypothetical protein HN682_04110 [Candidatus Peregrinibacteria bacterium]|nr:hypothetical protein [Candidatus Peregrinibacteria bacterium]
MIKFIKTHEKGELIAERMTFWGTFLGFISIGSASGINLSGNDVLVVTIANGGLFSIAMLFIGHHIRVITLQDRIYQNRNNIT